MQTFLMYRQTGNLLPGQVLNKSIKKLDYKRLGKQRVESMQIINAIEGKTNAWKNHPTVRMWFNYLECLKLYHNLCIIEWKKRGYKNTMKLYRINYNRIEKIVLPHWLNKKFITAHRSNLLRKDFKFYSQYNWNVPDDLPYYWPL